MENQIIKFGTDGIRSNASQFPFTKEALHRLGKAISKWSQGKYHKKNPSLLIATDTRTSCPTIKKYLTEGLLEEPLHCFDAGVMPTPAVYLLINPSIDFGIMISASHNPYQDNGIKIFDSKAGKLSAKDEETIENNFLEATHKIVGRKGTLLDASTAQTDYVNHITSKFKPDLLKDRKVVLDCANGATYQIAPKIFRMLGAQVTTIGSSPNGKNINHNCGSLSPQHLIDKVVEVKADIGFAFDGDGDRVAAVSKNGQIKDGDDLMTIILQHPQYHQTKKVVGTVMTNLGMQKYLKSKNIELERTKVGDKYISEKLDSENLQLGGESSGHIIVKDYLNSGDGIFAALKASESIVINNNWEMTSFEKYPQVLINLPVSKRDDLNKKHYQTILEKEQKNIPQGRVIVRFSGTENVLRIMVEDFSKKMADTIASALATQLQEALEG